MRVQILVGAMMVAVVGGGCKRTSNGDVVIDKPGSVHVTTQPETLQLPHVSVPHIRIHETVDTVNTPTIGTKKTVVKHPSIDVSH